MHEDVEPTLPMGREGLTDAGIHRKKEADTPTP